MNLADYTTSQIKKVIKTGLPITLATQHYPSRGQTATQELYQTAKGKLFLKRTSDRNLKDCQIDKKAGTLAEREFWSYKLASNMGLDVPALWLIDEMTTVQVWLDFPDACQFSTSQGRLDLHPENIFDCALFDWLTGQVDRHSANYLYDFSQERIILIDSAHCFLKYTGSIPDYLSYFEGRYENNLVEPIHTDIKICIQGLKESELEKIIKLRDEASMQALAARLNDLRKVNTIQDCINLYRRGPR